MTDHLTEWRPTLKSVDEMETEKKLEILIKALKFYAHGKSWSQMGSGCYADIGNRARMALKRIGELK